VKVEREWRDALLQTADVLADAGHAVVDAQLSYPLRFYLAIGARWYHGAHEDSAGIDRASLEPRTRMHARIGAVVERLGLVREADRHAWRAHVNAAFRRFDVLMTPMFARDPIAAEAWSSKPWLANVNANVTYAPFPSPWNLAGFPAASVPVADPAGGPPRAVQIVAPDGGEPRLLALAAQLETLQPWERQAPMARQGLAG
jgi:amidase